MAFEFDSLSNGGRTLCCQFKCQRCGALHETPLKDCMPNDEGSRYIRNLAVPKGWSDNFYGRLLCAECTEKLKAFMRMDGEKNE